MDSECQDMYLTYLYAGKLEIFSSCVCESLLYQFTGVSSPHVLGAILPNTVHLTYLSSEEHEITLIRSFARSVWCCARNHREPNPISVTVLVSTGSLAGSGMCNLLSVRVKLIVCKLHVFCFQSRCIVIPVSGNRCSSDLKSLRRIQRVKSS